MQDLASVHTCRSTQELLKAKKIITIDWVPKGADLNPIEKVWAEVKNYLYVNKSKIECKDDIWGFS